MAKSINLIQYIKEEKMVLEIIGYCTIPNNKYKKMQNISATILISCTLLHCVLGTIDFFYNLSNIPLIAQICSVILTQYAFIGKTFNIMAHHKNILEMESLLQDPLFTELESFDEEKTVTETLKLSRVFKKMFAIQVFSCLLVQIWKLANRKFPLEMWFPFDEYDHYYSVYTFEYFVAGSSAIAAIAMDALLLSLLDLCSSQFVLFNNRLLEIGSTPEGECIKNDELLKKLKKYIEQHNCIYRFSDLIQDTFSIGLFLEILCIAAILCFSAFSVLVTPMNNTEFLTLAVYAQCMIFQIAVHCFFGQKLENVSNQVTRSCYMSKWYECSLEVQKYILIIMRRANRNVVINAAGIFPLNLENLKNVLSSAYSFFTIVWQFYDEGDRN